MAFAMFVISSVVSRASHVQLFWIFMLFEVVNTVKLNFKAGLFSSTFQFEHSFLAKSQCKFTWEYTWEKHQK